MIVLDASAGVAALLNDGAARAALGAEQLHAPHLIDAEVASALRRRSGAGELAADAAVAALGVWQRLGLIRSPMLPLLERAWELRDNLSSYDACYVALAEELDCALLTLDGRLAGAPGIRCTVTVLTG